ncbi:MAG: NAD(P)-dependent oxidoreductase [Rudaea sp.]|uniref:NAD-dependent epimerase/dehydratase family protein n=1 Tax=unclassified Rudaea TaxID=2627037 RepID=UPI0010F77AA8|nr:MULTISPECIES: NAD(P)-dependent oxidoreductase [unclassified Rudaea]MBN8888061.1 NAD(P)-dependent oxidoreductase [Rudaea sp.]
MKILVTGSSGHLGEALMRRLRDSNHETVGIDILPSAYTDAVGSIADRDFVRHCMRGVDAVLHAATLHKPHVATHARQDFIDTNISGTLNLLEEAVAAKAKSFIYTSTTSAFGDALTPPPGAPAAWITEDVVPIPKNIYGVTKVAAENLCQLFRRKFGLPCLVLRTSRFFPEADDNKEMRDRFVDANIKANEFLYRRVDVADIVDAHLLAIDKAPQLGFGRYIISATTPFARADLAELRNDASGVLHRLFPDYADEYARHGWHMFDSIDRVYVNELARRELGWEPRYDFAYVLDRLRANEDFRSPLAQAIGAKGYHEEVFEEGPFPVD